MTAPSLGNREAVSRAEFFLKLARACPVEERAEHEAFLEASIIFARAELHRMRTRFAKAPGWRLWWSSIETDSAVRFFTQHRNFILKEGSAQVHQIINFNPVVLAEVLYYFETPDIPAAATVERHLTRFSELYADAQLKFGMSGR